MSKKTPEFIMRFARACCPSSPDLFLCTGEENMLDTASETIESLSAEVERLKDMPTHMLDYMEEENRVFLVYDDNDVATQVISYSTFCEMIEKLYGEH